MRADLVIPADSQYLHRAEILCALQRALESNQGISVVALTGPGGAGKTTLARYYAKHQKAPFLWEINAEKHGSLARSFEQMAYKLAQTSQDHQLLKSTLEIKNTQEKQERLVSFVKDKLKDCESWFLIYDNVEKFAEIQAWVPLDESAWGKGQVLITTRDGNIQNNRQISHTIYVTELSAAEKTDLFRKIIGAEGSSLVSGEQREALKAFLAKLPPFPLDISIAAYYLRSTHISYQEYLENLGSFNRDFQNLQENILKASGDYTRTRYSIVALSAESIIKEHPDFEKLLLLLSLVDSQDIPADLLTFVKEGPVVHSFIFNLKRYSMLTKEPKGRLDSYSALSVHRGTQHSLFQYLKKKLTLEEKTRYLEDISQAIEKYIDHLIKMEDMVSMKGVVSHCKRFLSHQASLPLDGEAAIRASLAFLCFYIDVIDAVKARDILNESLKLLGNPCKNHYLRVGNTLKYLGTVHRYLEDFPTAMSLVTRSLSIFEKFNDHAARISALVDLSLIYRDFGDYGRSIKALEQSLCICAQHPQDISIKPCEALYHLGVAHAKLGHYKKSRYFLKKSLKLYQQGFPKHWRVSASLLELSAIDNEWGYWEKTIRNLQPTLVFYRQCFHSDDLTVAKILMQLGIAHCNLGHYKKAQEYLTQSVELCKKLFPDKPFLIYYPLVRLGNLYGCIGEYDKALNLIKRTLQIYETTYGKSHVETGHILEILAQVYLRKGDFDHAEVLFLRCVDIFQHSAHPRIYAAFEGLADISLKRQTKDPKQADVLRNKAKTFLEKAKAALELQFPHDSPHLRRIRMKLEAPIAALGTLDFII